MAQCKWTKCFHCKQIRGVGRWHVMIGGQECIKLLCSDCVKELGAYRKGHKPQQLAAQPVKTQPSFQAHIERKKQKTQQRIAKTKIHPDFQARMDRLLPEACPMKMYTFLDGSTTNLDGSTSRGIIVTDDYQ